MSMELPPWASEMRDLFRSGSAAQFLLHGNVFDVVPAGARVLREANRIADRGPDADFLGCVAGREARES